MAEQVADAVRRLEEHSGKRLGDDADSLLVSVRSGARESMPGMLDTVLNLGLNDTSVQGLARSTENERFAWDFYRRFVQMFDNVSRGILGERFEDAIAQAKERRGVTQDTELDADALRARPRDRAWRSRAMRSRETRSRAATFCPTPRVRTWSRACAPLATSPRCRIGFPMFMCSSWRSSARSNRTQGHAGH
jgi:hypothetical protein